MPHSEGQLKTQDGLALRTQVWTPNSQPRAFIVLSHGQGDWSDRYAHVATALNEGGYAVYAYDLRGHGKSGGQRGHTPDYDHLLDDLQVVVEWAVGQNAGRKLFLLGHSMGGQLTLNYVLRRKSPAAGAVVTSPWLGLTIKTPAWVDLVGRAVQTLVPNLSQSNQIRGAGEDKRAHDVAFLDSIGDAPQEHGQITAREFFAARDAGAYGLSHAAEFRLPLAMFCGGADPIASTPAAQEFFDKCGAADKTFKAYPGLYHEVFNEFERAAVIADVRSWLDKRA